MSELDISPDKDKILSTPARRKLYQARMEGKTIKDAAKIAGIGYGYARELCAGLFRPHLQFNTELGINALVKQEQGRIQAKTAEKLEITEERVQTELARLAFADPAQMYDADGCLLPIHEMPEDVRRAISTLEQTPKGMKARTWSKPDALDALGKHIGFYERDNAQKQTSLAVFLKGLEGAEPNLSENGTKMINSTQVPIDAELTSEPKQADVPMQADTPDVVGQEGAE